MLRPARIRSLVFSAVVAPTVWLGDPGEARACSPEEPDPVSIPDLLLPADNIPADGVVLGRINCEGCTTADIQFETDAGPVEGSFETVVGSSDPRLFLWRPSAALDPNEVLYAVLPERSEARYSIHVSADDYPPAVYVDLDTKDYPAGDEVGCIEYSASTAGLCTLPTYHTQTESRLVLFLALGYASQYLYEATYSADGVETTVSGLGADIVPFEFSGAPEEACYSLAKVDPADGSKATLDSNCLTHPLLEVGLQDKPHGDVQAVLASCLEPDPLAEDAWCERYREPLLSGDCANFAADSCAAALEACEVPTEGTGGAAAGGGSDSGSGGKTTGSGGTASGSGGSPTETGGASNRSEAAGGCSMAPRPSSSTALDLLGLAALLGLSLRGRLRQ